MKKLISIAVASLVSLSANNAFAASAVDTNRTIVKIGTQNGSAYIAVSPALSIAGGCLFDIVYISGTSDLTTAAGKAYYATLLTAYSQGKPISRLDYANASSGNQCFVSLIEVQ